MLVVVAVAAMGLGVLGRELPIVRIGMACLALLRSPLESRGVFRRCLVTFAASDGAVRSHQREFRLAVVKSADVRPGLGIVACLTAERCAVRPFARHPVVELSLVRILVAGSARPVFKLEWQNLVRAAAGA